MRKFLLIFSTIAVFAAASMIINGCSDADEHDHDHGDDDSAMAM